ncbi:MAG: hypothetical protein H7287_08345 [Thermoleophilia bacterium]|nr:hypothetical protein [Thermoleophilia bacterium]
MTVSPTTGLTAASLPQIAAQTAPMTSPLDGTSSTLGAAAAYGSPGLMGATGYGVPTLTGAGASGAPQTNATNQTALAPNGDVNQSVTNQNQYTNKYYNIIVPNGAYGGVGNLGGLLGGQGNAFIDPQTGVLYVQKDNSVLGWFRRLFTGGY